MHIKRNKRNIYAFLSADMFFFCSRVAKDDIFVYNISVTEKMTASFGKKIEEQKGKREEMV